MKSVWGNEEFEPITNWMNQAHYARIIDNTRVWPSEKCHCEEINYDLNSSAPNMWALKKTQSKFWNAEKHVNHCLLSEQAGRGWNRWIGKKQILGGFKAS